MSNIVKSENSIPSAQDFATMKELGKMALASGFLPASINTAEKAVIIMLKGRELGIPPMQAFSSIAVVNGKPTMSAELMLSMIFRNVPGAIVNFVSTDSNECVIQAQRPHGKPSEWRFSMDDAKRAGLAGKGPWVSYPSAMLRARCISSMARAMFPDALSGVVYTPEELGAEVDGDGAVLEVSAPKKLAIEVNSDEHHADESSVEAEPWSPGDEEIKYGFNRGKRFKDVTIAEVRKTIHYIHSKKVSTPDAIHFVEVGEAFLKAEEMAENFKGAVS